MSGRCSSSPIIRVGTAGWAIPADVREAFPSEGSGLSRYAAQFSAVEINSSFYRSHRASTYARWGASVPPQFRFAVKLPKTITHVQRLVDCNDLLASFVAETAELGDRLGPLLVQMPPSLDFLPDVAATFFGRFRERFARQIVCEPRHASWFTAEADTMLTEYHVARAVADPAPVKAGMRPGGHLALAYFRLHGSPNIYRSPYGAERLPDIASAAATLTGSGQNCWVMFDNTASGAAAADALELSHLVDGRRRKTAP